MDYKEMKKIISTDRDNPSNLKISFEVYDVFSNSAIEKKGTAMFIISDGFYSKSGGWSCYSSDDFSTPCYKLVYKPYKHRNLRSIPIDNIKSINKA